MLSERCSMKKPYFVGLALGIGLFFTGLLIGHNIALPKQTASQNNTVALMDEKAPPQMLTLTSNFRMSDEELLKLVDKKSTEDNLRELTKEPHMAGTERQRQIALMIQERLLKYGFDSVNLDSYDVLLSQPDSRTPNLITLFDGSGHVVFTSKYREEPILPSDEDPNFVHAFMAYSPAGTVKTPSGVGVVYANYARVEDFERLEKMNIQVRGHIVMARYGKIYRGNKVAEAAARGAVGIIMFSDPNDVALEGYSEVYPKKWWLPGSGIQRGSSILGEGDPLTPGWPSTDYAYRIPEAKVDLPKIPAQPIGYEDATVILEKLGGPPAPEDWKGGLKGIKYNIGPNFNSSFVKFSLQLSTHNRNVVKKTYNVIAAIQGYSEPDRYVLVGNHIDAWGYGAVDPSSGTAQLLEVARIFGGLRTQHGWRPRRTLMVCFWGAEEFALLGSTEFVEKNDNILKDRTVSYLNTDICSGGTAFQAGASPHLWDVVIDVTKKVPGISGRSKSLYEEWEEQSRKENPMKKEFPSMGTLGSGSDYASFINTGIPSMDFSFTVNKTEASISIYPSYHTGYETFFMMSNLTDPGFLIHEACSRVTLLLTKRMLESPILPFNLTKYPLEMLKALDQLKESGFRDKLLNIDDKYGILEMATNELVDSVSLFMTGVLNYHYTGVLNERFLNDRLMKFEQNFILENGLPNRPLTKHAVFAPSQFDSYASSAFPGIADLLYKYDSLTEAEKHDKNEAIKKHVSDLIFLTKRAERFLDEARAL